MNKIHWLTRWWDWIDSRQIDKHALSMGVFYGTIKLTEWAMAFASAHADRPGMDIATIIAAVTAPYMALQAAAIKCSFEARTSP